MFQPNAINSKAKTDSSLVRSGRACVLLLIVLLSVVRADAQTGGAAPPNNAPGRPAGSYQLSGFDSVNLFNGNLNFSLPLLQVSGRGSARIPVTLNIDSTRWKLGRDGGLLNESARLNIAPDINPVVNYIELTDGTTRWLCRCSDESVEYFSARYQITHHVRFDRVGDGLTDPGGTLTEARYYRLDPDGWQGVKAGYGPGVLQGRIAFRRSGKNNLITSRLTRIVFTAPDGTETELRDRATYGRPSLTGQTNPPRGRVFVSADGKAVTFIADAAVADDPAEMDAAPAGDAEENLWMFAPDGFLLFADGTRYRVDDGLILWVRDRNGNLVTFDYDSGGRVKRITDALNRVVMFSYYDRPDPADPAKFVRDYDRISFSGFGGQPRSILVRHRRLSEGGVLRADFPAGDSFRTRGSLFPQYEQGSDANLVFDTEVVTAVELPDGRSYRLLYNHHGEIARVTLPTGGAIEYDYHSAASSLSTQRAVWRRRVYEGGGGVRQSGDVGAPTLTQTYKAVLTGSVTDQPYRTVVTAEQWQGPDGAGGMLLTRERHYFRGWADTVQAGFYPPAMEGREEKAETLDTTGDGATAAVLRRVTYDWRQRPAAPDSPEGWNNNIPRDLRMVEAVTTLENGLSSKITSVDPGSSTGEVGFDRYNNQTDLWEYDYKVEGEPWKLLRHTHTKYLTVNPVNGKDYACDPDTSCGDSAPADNVIHIRSLPEEQWVNEEVGDANKRALTRFEYDNYHPDPGQGGRHAALVSYGGISGLCVKADTAGQCSNADPPSYKTRGNLTAATAYLLSGAGGELASVVTNSQYDIAGNVVKAIGARGYPTDFSFEDNFGTPDASARDHTAPPGHRGEKTYAFVTRVTNAAGHVAHSQYDYHTGSVVNFEDANGTVMSLTYGQGDPLDRLTQVVRAANYPDSPNLRSQTTYTYDDAGRKATTKSDLRAYGDNLLKGESFYDGLGRTTEERRYEDATQYVATITAYDALGRVSEMSNPYRPLAQPAESPVWAATEYDALGRVTVVTTRSDDAKVYTLYDGARTMMADQAGKRRITKADALGRLTDVWEVTPADPATEQITFPVPQDFPHPAPTAGYRTSYAYDVVGSLRKVEQGGQRRHFAYDSLGRLLRASHPEQEANADLGLPPGLLNGPADGHNTWSLAYEYDEAGNLKKRTDARGVETSYSYDALGRLTGRSYTDVQLPQGGTLGTPAVKYFYDDSALPAGAPAFSRGKSVGRLVAVTYGGADSAVGSYAGHYDEMGGARYSAQVTALPDAAGQLVPQPPYECGYEYNLDGTLKSKRYPSGRVIESEYDSAGRLAGVKKQGGDYYAGGDPTEPNQPNALKYTAHGAGAGLRLGNGLWEHARYNNRLQVEEIGLGTSRANSSKLKLEFDYHPTVNGVLDPTKNNGSVHSQRISVPADGGTPEQVFAQSYTYDALSRLKSASEANGTADTWKQSYSYDRYGNRQLGEAQTTRLNNVGATVPAVDSLNRSTVNPAVSASTNRITEAGYSFDAAGNLLCDPRHPCGPAPSAIPYFDYNAEGKMVRAGGGAQAGGAEYVYDGAGRRVKKVSGSQVTVFVYDAGGLLVAEYSNQVAGGGTSYLTQDMLGSTRVVTDHSGNVQSRHDYRPFGEEINSTVAPKTGREFLQSYDYGTIRQKFTGYERDEETELDFAQARYYNSEHGRFTAVDPLTASANAVNPQSWNRYTYVLNNPLIMIDPTGEIPGDYYDRDGNWLFSDNINDNKVYLATAAPWAGGGTNYEIQELSITHTQFQTISNIVRQEGATDDTNEYLWIAHGSNNEARATSRSLYNVLMSSFSSVPRANKTPLATTDNSLRANAARAGVLNVLSGETDPTGGARRWDGTDFLAWGLNSPNGTPHNKFEEYGTIAIPEAVYNSFVSSQGATSIRYGRTRYTMPADVFDRETNPNNWGRWRINGNTVSGFLYVRDSNGGILYATGTAGKSIFWTVHYYWERD